MSNNNTYFRKLYNEPIELPIYAQSSRDDFLLFSPLNLSNTVTLDERDEVTIVSNQNTCLDFTVKIDYVSGIS